MMIAALDTGSSFEGMGASREAAFSCLAEVVLFLDFIILALLSKSFVLSRMVEEIFYRRGSCSGRRFFWRG